MGFLERAIRRGVSDAVGKAIGKAIEPTVTDLTNKAANAIDQSVQNTEQQAARSSGLEGAMANLERSVQGYATEAAQLIEGETVFGRHGREQVAGRVVGEVEAVSREPAAHEPDGPERDHERHRSIGRHGLGR